MEPYSLFIAVLFAIIHTSWTHPMLQQQGLPKAACGYDSCPPVVPGMVNVHMVPHTHDDVGWLKTVDQYYYGSRTNIQRAGVQYIIDSVVRELSQDPSKRFIWVETAFLWKWWLEQDDVTRDQVRGLVNSGQLEIISGAWSMNDEAVTHYQSIIDQFTWGFRILNDTFGECSRPTVGWQIDPFGHSREMASLLARFGFDGVFFARLDYQDKAVRFRDKTAEVVWQGSPDNLGTSSDLFTHAFFNHYSPPPGFCFDILCSDDPMIDNPGSPDYNIPKRVEQFVDFVHRQAASYRSNNIILTMGEDFTYSDAHVWYKNMDKIIKYVNAEQEFGGNVSVFYSTPSCYLKAANDENITWPTKTDDYFPYASDFQTYWVGYFTSKPTAKYFERLGNNFLQVSKQLLSLAGSTAEDEASVTVLREAMGVMQHHDAITGTMKDHVAQDYYRIVTEAFEESGKAAETAVNKLLDKTSAPAVSVVSCLRLNISECAITEASDTFVVTVYNPLSRPVSQYVRLPVVGADYSVTAANGSEVVTQLVPIPASVLAMVGRNSTADKELVFRADSLPPMGFRSYYVTRLLRSRDEGPSTRDSTFGNERIVVTLDNNGTTKSININGVDVSLQQTFNYYIGAFGNAQRSSGAYIFRPEGIDTIPADIVSAVVYKGPLVEEVHQTFGDGWISQVIRVYSQENHVEFEWMVGPIPDENEIGKEIISLFATDLANNATFYTDSNGRELLKRIRDFRQDWTIDITETISSNYYPIVSKLLIRDEVKGQEVAVLVDRAQGGSSIRDGEIELMVHRRLFHDDGFGVGEPLNEVAYGQGVIARGKHYVIAGPLTGQSPSLAAQERRLQQRKLLSAWTFISPTNGLLFQDWANAYNMEYSGMVSGLPTNVQVLTLEPWKDNTLLLRLEHIMEVNEDPTTVTVNLQDAFAHFTITGAQEMTLGGNQLKDDLVRLNWTYTGGQKNTEQPQTRAVDITAVTLDPMEIRTFVVDYVVV